MNKYFKDRQALKYYQVVREMILDYSPGESILDVGCGGSDIVLTGDFVVRQAVNTLPLEGFSVPLAVGTWPDVELPRETYDVVTCMQVMEHLPDQVIPAFAERLRAVAEKVLIVTVPFKWPKGVCKYHLQDPVDRDKMYSWLGRATEERVIRDRNVERLVCLYQM